MRAKKTTRRRKTLRKPARLKETRSRYVVRSTRPKAAVQEKQLEFSVCLPAEADAEAFTDKLIELVEMFKGTVGGGTVAAGA